MYHLSNEIKGKLSSLAQRKLQKGEIFLLAKALADSIPLPPSDMDNVALYTLSHRAFFNETIYACNDYTYIDDENMKVIYKLIDELTMWRFNVAYNPPHIIFKGDTNTVVDDVSNLLRYVDMTYICSVADIVINANAIYSMFRELCGEVKLQAAHKASEQ